MSEAVINALWCMLTGMIGIFSVTIVIILCIKLLNVLTAEKKDDGQNNNQ